MQEAVLRPMSYDVLEFSNVIAGGTVSTDDVVARVAKRIQTWFHRPDQEQSPDTPSRRRTIHLMQSVLDEGSLALRGLPTSDVTPETLEQTLYSLREELKPGGLRFRIFVTGKSRLLKPDIQEQLYRIGREALVNALRHSRAARIEAEVEYLPRQLRLVVRDNGCGIDPEFARSGRDGHWGLLGMRERAVMIGGRLRIWSKPGCGTELEVCVPGEIVENCA
jgi:signal transduction histidine kinase